MGGSVSRKRFSEMQVLQTLWFSGARVTCHRCRKILDPMDEIEREHILEIALGGEDEPHNCAYSHKLCHAIITNGTKATAAGSSKQRIAKIRRLQSPRKSKHPVKSSGKKLPSRPFPKRLSKSR